MKFDRNSNILKTDRVTLLVLPGLIPIRHNSDAMKEVVVTVSIGHPTKNKWSLICSVLDGEKRKSSFILCSLNEQEVAALMRAFDKKHSLTPKYVINRWTSKEKKLFGIRI